MCDDCGRNSDTSTTTDTSTSDTSSDTSNDTHCDTSSDTISDLPEDDGDLSDDGSADLPGDEYIDDSEIGDENYDTDVSEMENEVDESDDGSAELSNEQDASVEDADVGNETDTSSDVEDNSNLPDINENLSNDGSEDLPEDGNPDESDVNYEDNNEHFSDNQDNLDDVHTDVSNSNTDNVTSDDKTDSKKDLSDADDVKSEDRPDNEDTNMSNDNKDEFFGFGKKGTKDSPREFDTQKSKNMVPRDEYKKYKKMYDHFDTLDIPQDYKNVLCDRYSKMDPELKTMYNDYSDRLKCLDTQTDRTAYYSKSEGGFKIDYNDDLNNRLGAGNTYFHESGHMIDSLKGTDANSVNSASYDGYMSEAVHEDYYNAINNIMRDNNCDDATAQQILSKELKSNPIASNTVSDVFGGVSNNKVHGAYGHWGDYWSNRGPDAVGKEAFAEITADRACNNIDSINFTNKYLPNTVKRYNEIISRRK